MGNQISKELRQCIQTNNGIIASQKSSLARQNKLVEKYGTILDAESKKPSNRFNEWVKMFDPYQDAIVSARVIDYEIQKRYESYVNELAQINAQYLVTQEAVDQLQYHYEIIIEKLFKLEKKLVDQKMEFQKRLNENASKDQEKEILNDYVSEKREPKPEKEVSKMKDVILDAFSSG